MSDEAIVSRSGETAATPLWDSRATLSIGALSVATFALVFSEFLPAGLLTPLAAGLSISEGLAGQTVTATALMGAVSALLIGLLIGRMDRRTVMLALCGLVVLSNLAAAFAGNFAVLLAARLLLGIAIGGFWALVAAVVARLVSMQSIGRGMSMIFIGVSAATICAPPLAALIAELLGWRSAFALGAAAGGLAFAVELVSLPRLPVTDTVRPATLLRLTRRAAMQLGLLAVVAVAGGHFAGFTYIRALLETVTQLPPTLVAAVLLGFGVANFLGNLAGGVAADRWIRGALASTGMLLGLSTLGLALFGAQPAIAAALVAVWGFAFGAAPIVLQTWMAKAAPDHLESAGGLFIATFQIAIALGAALGGLVVDHRGVASAMLVAGAAGLFAAALASVRIRFGVPGD